MKGQTSPDGKKKMNFFKNGFWSTITYVLQRVLDLKCVAQHSYKCLHPGDHCSDHNIEHFQHPREVIIFYELFVGLKSKPEKELEEKQTLWSTDLLSMSPRPLCSDHRAGAAYGMPTSR